MNSKTNVFLYGTCPYLMAFLQVIFRGNAHFQLVGTSCHRKELIGELSEKEVDVILLSHDGVLDFNVLTFVNDFHSHIRMIGISYNQRFLRRSKLSRSLFNKGYPAHEQPLEQYLQAFETIHFQLFNNIQNQKEYEHLLLYSDEAHYPNSSSGSDASTPT